jgi:hypothetical protein
MARKGDTFIQLPPHLSALYLLTTKDSLLPVDAMMTKHCSV